MLTKKSAAQKKLLAVKVKEIVKIMMSATEILNVVTITAKQSLEIFSMRRMIAV